MSTIRIAHASDLHCCERNRLEDWRSLHRILVAGLVEAQTDILLLTGDLFHARSTVAERNAMAEFLIAAAEHVPVAIVKGNHDAAGDLDIYDCLASRNQIAVRDRPGTDVIETQGGTVAVIGLPWFDRAHLVAGLSAEVDADASRNLTIEAARQLLTTMRAHANQARDMGYVPVLAGHVMVAGSETSTGQVLIGTTVELAPGDILDVGCEYAALGHIHKTQTWADGRVAYAGSTWAQNFGEDHPHGWRFVTIQDGRFVSSEFRELPSRRIVLLEADCTQGILSVDTSSVHAGDLVRYRYRIAPEDLPTVDEAAIIRAFTVAGAAEVKIEPVLVHQARVRSKLIIEARDTWSKISAWLAAKGIAVEPAALDRLREKLARIEAPENQEVMA